jgi:hypothetical protein
LKKVTITVLCATFLLTLILFLSPLTTGKSVNPCSPCHGSYYQYLDIAEEDSSNQIPTTLNVNQTKTVSVVIQNIVNTDRYSTLSGVVLTLSSAYGHFSISVPAYNVNDMPTGSDTATWQIRGISEGFDYFLISATGINYHKSISFSDSYLPYPLITVGQPTGPTPPAPTPPPTPPQPSTSPSTPQSTIPPTSTPKPSLDNTPKSTTSSMPTNQDPTVLLLSPAQGEKWVAQTQQTIEWNASEGTNPLNITLEYSKLDSGQWTPIATSLQNDGSLTWKVPNDVGIFEIRVAVNDSSVPPRTALTTVTVEIVQNSPDLSLIIAAAALLTIAVIAAVLLTLKRKQKRQKNCNSQTASCPIDKASSGSKR